MAGFLAHAKDHARKGCAGHSTVRDAVARAGREGFRCFGCESVVRGKLAALDHLGACEGAQRRLDDAGAMPPPRANANRRRNPSLLDDASLTVFCLPPPPGSLRRITWTRRSSR